MTITSALYGVLMALIGGVLGSFVKSRPSLKKIEADREANLLSERAKEMGEMRKRIENLEAEQRRKDEKHEAERDLSAQLMEAEREIGRAHV